MFVVTKDTVWNTGILDTANVPRKFFGRVTVLPRRDAPLGLWARLIFEMQALRYFVALAPFVAAMFIWPRFAFPLAQAPLAMIIAIAFVEIKLLRLTDTQRETLVPEVDAVRTLDALAHRARLALRDLAAARGLDTGALHLVIEQSELARVAPFTLVTVQSDLPKPHLLDLTAQEREALTQALFDETLTEKDLQHANLRDNTFLRLYQLETRTVSAHARLAAKLRTLESAPA